MGRFSLKVTTSPFDVESEMEVFWRCLSAAESSVVGVVAGKVVGGADVVVRRRWPGLRCVEFVRMPGWDALSTVVSAIGAIVDGPAVIVGGCVVTGVIVEEAASWD